MTHVNIMKILVIGDLHGERPVIRTKDFDCMVCVGDFCSDKKVSKLYKEWFRHIKKNPENHLDVDDFFLSMGYSEKRIDRLEVESLRIGKKILKYLSSFGRPIFLVPGNWDQSYGESRIKDMKKNEYNYFKTWLDKFNGDGINPKLIKGLKNVFDCQFEMHEFMGANFIGYGLSNASENPSENSRGLKFNKKEFDLLKKTYENIVKRLIASYGDKKNNLPSVFISHNVPHNTRLDVIKDKDSYAYKKHLGSSVSRVFCLRRKPELCLCGHIHEGKGKCKLGKTIIVNPGKGKEAQVLIDFDEARGKVRKVKFLEK